MASLSSRPGVSRRGCVSWLTLFLAASCVSLAADLPPISSTAHHYLMPIQGGRRVYRFAEEGPQRVLDFWKAHGREWQVSWDALLDTPRLVYPLEPFRVAEPEPLAPQPRPEFIRSVEAFVDANADFFGASSATLSEPYVYHLAGAWILVFEETTPSGIPIRGANLRAVVYENGMLGWVQAFLARGVADVAGALLTKEDVENTAASNGGKVETSTLQMGFGAASIASAFPIWSLWVKDAEGRRSEHIVDAASGDVLARRVVVKHFDGGVGAGDAAFDANGVVLGTCPDLQDLFVGPVVPEKGQGFQQPISLQPLPGILIRDQRFAPRVLTNSLGRFAMLVEFNPATLNASLETRSLGWKGFAPLLNVEPLDSSIQRALPPELDADGDATPDLSQTRITGDEFHFELFAAGQSPTEQTERSWWFQSFEHARTVLDFADGVIRDQLVTSDEGFLQFLPIQRLIVHPISGKSGIQAYEPNGNLNEFSVVQSAWSFNVGEGKDTIKEDVLPTFLQHEVGHHIVFQMTRCVNSYPESLQLEEGIADVMAAYANKRSEVGFKRNEQGDLIPSSLGFDLKGHNGADFRSLGRTDVGEGFWLMRQAFLDGLLPAPADANPVLFAWLAAHQCSQVTDHTFDSSHNLVEELILVDDMPGLFKKSDGDLRTGTPHLKEITEVFRGRLFFDAPFSRGDATLDGKLDLSDAVATLKYLFLGEGKHDCKNAMDADDNGKVEISDGIRILSYLFLGGGDLPSPFLGCGLDHEAPGTPGNLGCRDFTCPF